MIPPFKYICNIHFTGPPLEKSCSTYDILGLRTSLREHSGWSSDASRSWSSHQNILWMYRHEYFLPSQQFTTVSLKGIPLRLLIYYPHLMMAFMLKIVVIWWQSIWGRQRKTEPMPDAIRLQRVCGMIIRECFESVIHSHDVLSPNDITLCFHCFTVQNTNTKKSVHGNHKVVASSLPILGSSSTTRNSFTTYFMSTNCFLTHNLWSNGCWIDMEASAAPWSDRSLWLDDQSSSRSSPAPEEQSLTSFEPLQLKYVLDMKIIWWHSIV